MKALIDEEIEVLNQNYRVGKVKENAAQGYVPAAGGPGDGAD